MGLPICVRMMPPLELMLGIDKVVALSKAIELIARLENRYASPLESAKT